MNCINCGKMLEPDMKFCIYCGAPVSSSASNKENKNICSSCGSPLIPGTKFCIYCGAKISAPSSDPVPEPGTVICSSCGAKIAPGYKFCLQCGTTVGSKTDENLEVPDQHGDKSNNENVDINIPAGSCTCPKCGAKLSPDDKFCIECGTPVSSKTDQEPGVFDQPEDTPQDKDKVPNDNPGEDMPETGPAPNQDETPSQEAGPEIPESSEEPTTEDIELRPLKQMLVLTNLDIPGISYTRPIRDEISIGRSLADILIKDDLEVSRIHCCVLLRNGGLYLIDQGSKNGTMYKNQRIPSWQETPFTSGDIIRMGKYTYSLELKIEPS